MNCFCPHSGMAEILNFNARTLKFGTYHNNIPSNWLKIFTPPTLGANRVKRFKRVNLEIPNLYPILGQSDLQKYFVYTSVRSLEVWYFKLGQTRIVISRDLFLILKKAGIPVLSPAINTPPD